VFRYLGSPELVAASEDQTPSPVFADAALLAAATRAAMKFQKEEVAVLAGITSPTFAVLAGKTARKLRGKVPDPQYAAVLLLYVNGAMDTAAGKNSPLARDYQKALRDLKDALQGADASQSVAQKLTLSGIPSAAERGAIFAQAAGTSRSGALPPYAVGLPGKAPTSPSRFYPPSRESIGAVKKDPKDLGTLTRAPSALDFVPFEVTIELLYGATENLAKAQAFAKANAAPTTSDPVLNAAQRTASWIIRTADPKVLAEHVAKQNRFVGGISGRISWLTLTRRYGATAPDKEKEASAFEKHAAGLMVLAAKQAVARTGQTGDYATGGEWRPDVKSANEQVPQGPEAPKYVGLFRNIAVDPKIRPHAVFAAQVAYQKAYRKEPTLHALNWFGSFGYGLAWQRDVFSTFVTSSVTPQDAEFALRVSKTEALRMAGAAPAPQDIKNQVNIFIQFFGALGPALSSTLDALSQSLQVATDVLCTIFKVLAGPDVGGVLCSIFTAVLKFLFGMVKAATAAIFSMLKAISGLIGKLSAGDWMGALYEFFAGVNTAVVFILGAPIAEFLGVPFLKSDEKGTDTTSETFAPSMERMGEDLTKRNPFFLIMLTINVIAILTTPTPQNAGALMLTLTPVIALILVAPTAKALRATKEKWLEGYRTLVLADIQRALEAILRLIAGVIVGIMTLGDAINVMGQRLAKWAQKVGGAGAATVEALQFLVTNLQSRFTSLTITITRAFIKDSGFEMRELTDELYDLLIEFLALIPAFAAETGVFDKNSMASANILATVGVSTVKDARAVYDELVSNLDSRAQANLANEIAQDYGGRVPDRESEAGGRYRAPGAPSFDAKKNLPLFAVVAAMGLTLGFMLRGSRSK
jgi:hypothetical protein